MRRYKFPSLLLAADGNDATGSAPVMDGGRSAQEQTQHDNDAAFDAAAMAAIEAVQQSSAGSRPEGTTDGDGNEDGDDSEGRIKSFNSTQDGTAEDGSQSSSTEIDPNETPEQKAARLEREVRNAESAAERAKLEDKDALDKDKQAIADKAKADAAKSTGPKIDKPGDESLPFNKHPRWHEVIAERDTARTERQQYEQQYTKAKPLIERQQTIETFCSTNNIDPVAFQETLQMRALMNTDPSKALEQLEPVVASLKALAGKGIAPDLLQKVKDGVLDEASAQEITQLRAQTQHRRIQTEQQQVNQQRQVIAQMEQSVSSWFTAKKASDPSFDSKVDLVNGVFASLCNTQPPKSPADVTALLEKAYNGVNEKLVRLQPTPPRRKAPPISNQSSGTTSTDNESFDDFAARLVDKYSSGA